MGVLRWRSHNEPQPRGAGAARNGQTLSRGCREGVPQPNSAHPPTAMLLVADLRAACARQDAKEAARLAAYEAGMAKARAEREQRERTWQREWRRNCNYFTSEESSLLRANKQIPEKMQARCDAERKAKRVRFGQWLWHNEATRTDSAVLPDGAEVRVIEYDAFVPRDNCDACAATAEVAKAEGREWSCSWDLGRGRGVLIECSGCKAVKYCSRECQRLAWDAGHWRACAVYARTCSQP